MRIIQDASLNPKSSKIIQNQKYVLETLMEKISPHQVSAKSKID
ncbi:MAG: hypothetical protein AAFX46_02545 [Cyanobacteria bacterium J06636_27]